MPVSGDQALAAELQHVPNLQLFPNEPLAPHTRFALGGPARLLVDCDTLGALDTALAILRNSQHPFLLIGGGTNLIVADSGFDGIVLRYRASEIHVLAGTITAGSGAELEALVDASVSTGLAGLESLKRIPGWVGAAVYGNAGAYGQQISDRLTSVTFHDGLAVRQMPRESCGFRYRWSDFKLHRDWVILQAAFRLEPGDPAGLAARAEEIRAIRDEKFPPSLRCAGSIFKNLIFAELSESTRRLVPPSVVKGGKVPAAWFLEQVQAKGLSRGGIHVAEYHANLIYNDGSGSTTDLVDLIDELNGRVNGEFAVPLQEEVQYVGFSNRSSY